MESLDVERDVVLHSKNVLEINAKLSTKDVHMLEKLFLKEEKQLAIEKEFLADQENNAVHGQDNVMETLAQTLEKTCKLHGPVIHRQKKKDVLVNGLKEEKENKEDVVVLD